MSMPLISCKKRSYPGDIDLTFVVGHQECKQMEVEMLSGGLLYRDNEEDVINSDGVASLRIGHPIPCYKRLGNVTTYVNGQRHRYLELRLLTSQSTPVLPRWNVSEYNSASSIHLSLSMYTVLL